MNAKYKTPGFIGYSLFLIVISSLMTVLCYHIFVFNSFASDPDQTEAQREISAAQVAASPITENNSIIEIMSYGCHYCAANEDNLKEFVKTLPAGSTFKSIHLTDNGRGLSSYAEIFATLEAMGLEEKMRDSAYNTIITHQINLADTAQLNKWLAQNGVDIAKYNAVRNSSAVQKQLAYMGAVTRFYHINSTPIFIVNKRFVVAQDSEFPEFARRMLQLLKKGQ